MNNLNLFNCNSTDSNNINNNQEIMKENLLSSDSLACVTARLVKTMNMKQKYGNCVIIWRSGSSYTVYNDDAIVVKQIAGLQVKRVSEYSIVEFEEHKLDVILSHIVRKANMRVAICE